MKYIQNYIFCIAFALVLVESQLSGYIFINLEIVLGLCVYVYHNHVLISMIIQQAAFLFIV